jgi:hypothetical protein
MICAWIHDRTVAEDYYAAMQVVEKRLEVPQPSPELEDGVHEPLNGNERADLHYLATQLAEPDLTVEVRLNLVDRMCQVLNGTEAPDEKQALQNENGRRQRAPP